MCLPALSSPGKTSRSTDTGRPAGNRLDDRSPEDVRTRVDLIGRRVLCLLAGMASNAWLPESKAQVMSLGASWPLVLDSPPLTENIALSWASVGRTPV